MATNDMTILLASEAKSQGTYYTFEYAEAGYRCKWMNGVVRCEKSFGRSNDAHRHYLQTHLNDRQHACTEIGCGLKFAQKSALNTHMRIHTGQKPERCAKCGMCFSDPSSRKRHEVKRCNMSSAKKDRRNAPGKRARKTGPRARKAQSLASLSSTDDNPMAYPLHPIGNNSQENLAANTSSGINSTTGISPSNNTISNPFETPNSNLGTYMEFTGTNFPPGFYTAATAITHAGTYTSPSSDTTTDISCIDPQLLSSSPPIRSPTLSTASSGGFAEGISALQLALDFGNYGPVPPLNTARINSTPETEQATNFSNLGTILMTDITPASTVLEMELGMHLSNYGAVPPTNPALEIEQPMDLSINEAVSPTAQEPAYPEANPIFDELFTTDWVENLTYSLAF